MESSVEAAERRSGSRAWPVVSVALLAAAWAAYLLTLDYSSRLRERWGPAPDLFDAYSRDAHVGSRTLLYLSTVLLIDALAGASLALPSRRGWPRAVKVLAAVLLVPTALVHGLCWGFTMLFSG